MAQSGYIVREETSGETFECGEAEAVLAAAARSGKRIIQVGCRNGGCGVCKIRVVKGEYRTGKMSRAYVSEAEEKEGFALACRTRPLGSLEIIACRPFGDPETVSTEKQNAEFGYE